MPAERTSDRPELKQKPRLGHAPYKPQKLGGTTKSNDNPRGSVKSLEGNPQSNLTLHDWLTVFAYIDAHPDMSQEAVVEQFKSRHDGALIFTQSTLSRKLRDCNKLEARIDQFPNALSSKRPCVVTHPDVD
ncbi:hypothetical protein PISMIDRAFT_16207 [Pisolithus microcarpus 441]|uniref:Uncharacterized protein n=1 Tax=Pisolithus microcarpus 441 TaxID=765257 RepID=A0A0C9YPY9_9AGAM|nr:hypothetical protein PISMIDRAFT_16207 [Pisolithus microcarpus 441]